MTCPWCLGSGVPCAQAAGTDRTEVSGAERCKGSGKVGANRCPAAMADAHSRAVVSSLLFYEQGVLPVAGGWLEQPARWRREMLVAMGERNKIESAEMARAQREADSKRENDGRRTVRS